MLTATGQQHRRRTADRRVRVAKGALRPSWGIVEAWEEFVG
jgi:hypothetical protein